MLNQRIAFATTLVGHKSSKSCSLSKLFGPSAAKVQTPAAKHRGWADHNIYNPDILACAREAKKMPHILAENILFSWVWNGHIVPPLPP